MNIPASDNLHLHEEGSVIRIPLKYNLNDKGCLFAGSIYSGAILAAYRGAERLFAERKLAGDLVAKAASINYLKRIESDGRAVATAQGEPLLKPNGNHTLTIRVDVLDAENVRCAELTVEMVLLKTRFPHDRGYIAPEETNRAKCSKLRS